MPDQENEPEELEEETEPSDVNIFAGVTSGSVHITGVKMAYYHICHTKLWLFSHNIGLENEHENVQIGKMLHEKRYKKSSKEIMIDNTISIDFVKHGKVLQLHEVKKTKKMDTAHKAQMLFYLYYFKSKGVEAQGILNYPLINKTEEVIMSPEDEESLRRDIKQIEKIVLGSMPGPQRKRICAKCAYLEFCFCGG